MPTSAVDEAKAVIEAMKTAQPGPHTDVLERGFAELWNVGVDAHLVVARVRARIQKDDVGTKLYNDIDNILDLVFERKHSA